MSGIIWAHWRRPEVAAVGLFGASVPAYAVTATCASDPWRGRGAVL